MINETAVREFGWKIDNAVGKKIDQMRSDGTVRRSGRVIGVVKDFNFQPLRETLKPLVIRFGGGQFAIRLAKNRISSAMAYIESIHAKFNPDWPLNYRFLDDDLNKLYRKEAKLGQIIQYFTFLAIFIACMGLFGLASFTTERRTKEIGVRKVLGASVTNLVLLLSNEFTKLVLVAFVIATPIAWLAMNRWLENFAFRTGIHWWIFAMAGGISLLIALLTVSYQAIKAALANPVEALHYE
jgi:putative ABC transport system permease protein